MGLKEVANKVGNAAEYVTGADVFKDTRKSSDQLLHEARKKSLFSPKYYGYLALSGLRDGVGIDNQAAVVLYRLSGLDLATRAIRKIVPRKRKPGNQ